MANLLNRNGDVIATDAWNGLPQVNATVDVEAPDSEYILHIANTVSIADLPHDLLNQAAGIALQFPAFTDGRAYSQARELRQRGYVGEIRATGDVLADQLLAMRRCGFSTFELADSQPPETARLALTAFVHAAQPAVDNQGLQTRRLGVHEAHEDAVLS